VIKGLADVIPDVTPIDRASTNSWEDVRGSVEATGREWTPDFTSEERNRVYPPVMKHVSMAGHAIEYLVAQTEVVAHAG